VLNLGWKVERKEMRPILRNFRQAGVNWFAVSNGVKRLLHVVARLIRHTVDLQNVLRFKYLMGRGSDLMGEDGSQKTPAGVTAEIGARYFGVV
jgi:hypothetical protein